jgi:hypothetical protein
MHEIRLAQHVVNRIERRWTARFRPLRPAELTHVTAVIERWLRKQPVEVHADPAQGRLL